MSVVIVLKHSLILTDPFKFESRPLVDLIGDLFYRNFYFVHSSSTPSNADTPRTQQAKEAKKSQKKKEKSDQILTKLLNGDLTIDVPYQAKLIRIYISANSKDTTAERNALMTRVYPKLKEYCQSTGYDFQVVDMRWGVRDEATADHMTSELCMKELQLCQDISAGPSFVSFLSHKYGYRPFPPKIVPTEFETMLKVVEEQTDKDLLQKWFLKDENSIPEMYILQPITEVLPNYENPEASKKQRSKATGEWFKSFNQMLLVLRDASNKVLSEEDAIKYSISVTENEIEQGCSEIKNPDDSAHWFNRTIMDIARYQDDKASRMFIDKNGQEIDQNAIDLVNDLRENKLPSMLSSNSITTYDLSWLPEFGVDPEQSELHKEYLDKLCVDFERIMKEKIDRCITKRDNSLGDDKVVSEIIHHQSFCRQKVSEFTGRRKLLMKILPLLDDDDEDEEVDEMKLQEVGANETGEQKKVEDRPAVDTTEKEQKERQAVDTTEKEQKERKGKETEEDSEQKEEEANEEEDEEQQTRKGKGKKGRKQKNKHQQNQQKGGKGKGKKQKRFHDSDEEDEEKEEKPQQEQEKKPIKLCPDEERNSPIFIHGKPGSGLSSIMAKVALTANYEFPERLLITRFVGCTEGSIDLFELIYSICCQLKRALQMGVSSRPKALPEMIEQFHTILEETYEGGREILFIIDGLDKLNVGANQQIKWLMTRLPSNCRMLVSLSPNDEALVSIKDEFKGSSFIEVGGLQPKACKSLINKWLSCNKQKLTDEQYGILSECYRKSPTPLFLRFCFDQVTKWKSYHDIEDCSLESNIKDSMDRIFSDLEKVHGQALVSHTIGLIRASRHGLSDSEIEDLLSIDDEVLNDIYQQWSPPMRRVSSFTWIQIRNALGFCLTRKNVNGIVLNTFSHSQIQDAASERYHKDADDLETFRELLVDYFMGTWSNGICKPTKAGISGAKGAGEPQEEDRLVASQPNRFKHENSPGEHYNYRKLSELPFHLMKLKDVEKIKDNLLFNFDFLVATMQALGVQALLNTVSEASKLFSNDEDISYLYSILTSALPVLEKFPDQLACQIAGRVDEEAPKSGIIGMLERIKESDQPYFIPTKKCFQTEEVISTPEGFKGHTDAINDVVVLDNGKKILTVSEDKSLRIWKVDNSSEIQMNQFEDPIINVFPYQNDEKALLLFKSKLLAVNLSDFKTIYEESFQGERIGALTPDGSRFVMLCTEKKNYRVAIYDVSMDELVKERDFEHPKSKAGVTGSHFKDQIKVNNEYIAFTSGTNESINLRKINDRKFTEEITPSSPFQIFSLSEDGTVRIMSVIEQKSRFKPKKVYFAILKIGERGQVGREASEDIAEIEHEFVSKSIHLDLPNIDGGVQNKDMDPYPWGPDDYILVWMVYNSKQINLFGSQNKHERMVYELPISSKQKICHARILDSKRILVISKTSSKEPVIEILEADDLDIKSGPDLMEARETQYEDFKELEDEDEDENENEEEEEDEKNAVSAEAAGDGDILCLRNPNPNSNMMISIDPSEMLLNVWDTTLHVVTKSFSLGFVPKLMQFIDGNRVLMLNERKNSFMLLHIIEDEMVLKQQGSNAGTQNAQSQDQPQNQQNETPHQQQEQQQQDQSQPGNANLENNTQPQNDVFEDFVMFHSSDKYISRHITPGLNDKVVWIKQTNEFAITDERNNLKIFSLETGNQVELIETKMRNDCQRILGNQDGSIIVMFFSDEDQEKVSAHVYNMTTRSKVGEIERGVGFSSDFKLAALSENGQQLFIPNKEKNSILIFDVSNGSLLNTLPPFGNFNSSKTLPPFGKTLPPFGGYNPKTDTTITKQVLQTPATTRRRAYLPPVLVAGVTTISKGVEYHFLRCYEDQTWQPLAEVRLPSAVVEVHFSTSQDEKDGVYLLVETEESLLLFDFSAVVSHKTIQYVANLCLGDSKGCYQFCKRRIIAASVPKTDGLVFFQLCSDEMVSPEQKHVKPVKL